MRMVFLVAILSLSWYLLDSVGFSMDPRSVGTEVDGRSVIRDAGDIEAHFSMVGTVDGASVIAREGAQSIDNEAYPGFSAPVASRVRRFDACFGDFVAELKRLGLYDDSLIILTSDHGDSLGEEGRVGHAYGLFPEVIRIPLIVSLPARLRPRLEVDPAAPVYNTDVTPTLYRLLGHEPDSSSKLFGRPLFSASGESPPADEGVMVASSYGAVYGALLDSASRLYIIDTVNVREYAYALESDQASEAIPVDASLRRRGQATIRKTSQALADLYDYQPQP